MANPQYFESPYNAEFQQRLKILTSCNKAQISEFFVSTGTAERHHSQSLESHPAPVMPLRIALCPSAYFPHIGGVEEVSRQLARRLNSRVMHTSVITNRHPADLPRHETVDGLDVHRLSFFIPRKDLSSLLYIPQVIESITKLVSVIRRERIDILHVICASSNSIYAYLAKKLTGVRLVVSLHGETFADVNKIYQQSAFARWSLRKLLESADCVTACSQFTLDHAEQLLGLKLPNSKVIYNAVDLPLTTKSAESKPAFIMTAGRLVANKGFEQLIHAFAMLPQEFDQIKLRIIGDGPDMTRLKQTSETLGISHRVDFKGRLERDEISRSYNDCLFYVCASPIESFGIACLEAMSCKKAVIAPNAGGPPEFIGANEGILVDTTDVDAIKNALVMLLTNQDRLIAMGNAGYEKSKSFSWNAIAQSYLDMYQSVRNSQ